MIAMFSDVSIKDDLRDIGSGARPAQLKVLLNTRSARNCVTHVASKCDFIGVRTINAYLIEQAERAAHFPAKRHTAERVAHACPSRYIDPREHADYKQHGCRGRPTRNSSTACSRADHRSGSAAGEDFLPHSAANRAEQRRLSRFDAGQDESGTRRWITI